MDIYTGKKKFFSKKIIFLIISVLGLIGGYFIYTYFVSLSEYNSSRFEDSTLPYEQQVNQILDEVSNIMLLPNERPDIVVLVNTDVLQENNPEFFKDSREGDILLIYTDRVIIYREEERRIVNVAAVERENDIIKK